MRRPRGWSGSVPRWPSRSQLAQLWSLTLHSACVAFTLFAAAAPKEGRVAVQAGRHELWYRIHRPMALSSKQGAPLVVLHGGPQVPSDYLFDLAKVDYRSVVFFDQLGCGRSDSPGPSETAEYSIQASVADLATVLTALGVRRYHLLGQSWGGILAYEFLRSRSPAPQEQECLSLILSNTPTSVAQVEADANELIEKLGGASCPDVGDKFRTTHECRLPERPQLLKDAYAHAGTVWRGTSAIKSWALDPDASKISQPTLVVRGEHDFVTEESQEQWKMACPRVRFKSMADASHHCLLEDTDGYIEMVDSFLAEYD